LASILPQAGSFSSGTLVSMKISISWKLPRAGWKLPAYQLGAAGGKVCPLMVLPGLSSGLPPGPYSTPLKTSLAQLPREAQSLTPFKASSRYWKPVATDTLPAQVSIGSPDMVYSNTSWRVRTICQGLRPLAPVELPSALRPWTKVRAAGDAPLVP